MTTVYEVHGVLAGAYLGKSPKLENTLTHASFPGAWDTAICGRVRDGALADLIEDKLTCPRCISKVAKMKVSK